MKAIVYYSEGISREPANPDMYSNRSLAFLKVDQHFFAMKDGETTIHLIPDQAKGYYRKGQAELLAEMYHLAIKTFEDGLKACPSDEVLKMSLTEAKAKQEAYFKWKVWLLKKYTIYAGVIGSLLVIVDMLWQPENSMVRKPWLWGVILSFLAVLEYVITLLMLSIKRNSKATLLRPPSEI